MNIVIKVLLYYAHKSQSLGIGGNSATCFFPYKTCTNYMYMYGPTSRAGHTGTPFYDCVLIVRTIIFESEVANYARVSLYSTDTLS